MAKKIEVKTSAKPAAKKPPAKAGAGAKAPAKKPTGTRTKKVTGPTVAVFVDIENANASRDNLLELFTNIKNKGTVTYGKLYGFRFEKAADYDEIVAEHRLETVGRMRFKHGDDSVVDTRLVVDCIVAAESKRYDSIFVWAGVGDLMTLFAHIKQYGCKVLTVDLPDFDTTNKFIDGKIKLFSPHSLKVSAPVVAAPVAAYSAAAAAPTQQAPMTMSSVMARPAGSSQNVPPRAADSFGAIADDDDFDDEEFKDLDDDFDLDDLEDVEDPGTDEDDDGGDYDDLDDLEADDDIDDVDDLMDEMDVGVSGSDVFTVHENEKLLALTEQMLDARKKGKKFDVKKAAKSFQDDFGELSGGLGGSALEGAPGSVNDDKESKTKYGSAAFEYNAEQSGILRDPQPEDDDFGDFGKI